MGQRQICLIPGKRAFSLVGFAYLCSVRSAFFLELTIFLALSGYFLKILVPNRLCTYRGAFYINKDWDMEELSSLVEQAQTGDLIAFNTIVRQFQDMAVGYAYSQLRDFHLAEDAAQEAFIGAYLSLPELQNSSAFPGWFRRVIHTQCNRLTRRKRLATVELGMALEAASKEKGPDELVDEKDLKDRILAAIQDLPASECAVITLFYISELSQREIAAFLEIPVTTVNNRLHSSRKRLKKELVAVARENLQAQRPSRDDVFATEVRNHLTSMIEGDTKMSKELDFITDLLGQFLVKEDPETVAKILSRLDTTLTAVLGKLPRTMQGEVVYHLFQLGVGEFGLLRWTARDLGGIKEVAEILNYSGNTTERKVLEFLDSHDPELAETIRNYMFTFDDIARLPNQDIQQVLKSVDAKDLAIALKGSSEEIKDRMFSGMSERVRMMVQEEMASSDPVKINDVEEAQLRTVQTVSKLHEEGKVAIIRGEGDYIV